MSEDAPRTVLISADDAAIIEAAIGSCDGTWRVLAKRNPDQWKGPVLWDSMSGLQRTEPFECYGLGLFAWSVTQMGDLSDLSVLGTIDRLSFISCDDLRSLGEASVFDGLDVRAFVAGTPWELRDVSALAGLSSLRTLKIDGAMALRDLSPLSGLTQLEHLDLNGVAAVDITPLAPLSGLEHLDLSNCDALTDLSALRSMTGLRHLNLSSCNALSDLSPLGSLLALETLKASSHGLKDCDAFAPLGSLRVLKLDGESLGDIEGLGSLESLKTLTLSSDALTDISPLSRLVGLKRLTLRAKSLQDLTPLAGLSSLTYLCISGCDSLTDLTPLEALTGLTHVEVTFCGSLTDLSPLSKLPSLRDLDLTRCTALEAFNGLSGAPALKTLNARACHALEDLSELRDISTLEELGLRKCFALTSLSGLESHEGLTSLNCISCRALEDVEALASMTGLKKLLLDDCRAVASVPSLVALTRLSTLGLSGCESLSQLTCLTSLPGLTKLDLSGCLELGSPSSWAPLTTLRGLRELEGRFPKSFRARVLAAAAARREDAEFITEELEGWLSAAEGEPCAEEVLSAVAQAAAVIMPNEGAADGLVRLTRLAIQHDAQGIDGLVETLSGLVEHEVLAGAIDEAIAQDEMPLPPETLKALVRHMPTVTSLRDQTLLALVRTLTAPDSPAWRERTAQAVRQQCEGYAVTPSVHDAVLTALIDRDFGPVEVDLFGILSSDYVTAEDALWRDGFYERLASCALDVAEPEARDQVLSDLAAGLARRADAQWRQERLDALLKSAAHIDPDTSVLLAAIAKAHASVGRWEDASRAVFMVASPSVRDEALLDLTAAVLRTTVSDRGCRAVSLTQGLAEPALRREHLTRLGAHEAVVAAPVAYGQLVALLSEHPDTQQEVVAKAVEARPALAEAEVPSSARPVTQREQRLAAEILDKRDAAWRRAISTLDSALQAAVERRLNLED